jgi:uncharacterized protein YqkB
MENTENTEIKIRKAGIFTVKEVAEFLGARSIKWVYQHKHEIPGYFKLAGSHFFRAETLIKHIEEKALGSKNDQQENTPHVSLVKKEGNQNAGN